MNQFNPPKITGSGWAFAVTDEIKEINKQMAKAVVVPPTAMKLDLQGRKIFVDNGLCNTQPRSEKEPKPKKTETSKI